MSGDEGTDRGNIPGEGVEMVSIPATALQDLKDRLGQAERMLTAFELGAARLERLTDYQEKELADLRARVEGAGASG